VDDRARVEAQGAEKLRDAARAVAKRCIHGQAAFYEGLACVNCITAALTERSAAPVDDRARVQEVATLDGFKADIERQFAALSEFDRAGILRECFELFRSSAAPGPRPPAGGTAGLVEAAICLESLAASTQTGYAYAPSSECRDHAAALRALAAARAPHGAGREEG
jgi:hypothetical protein